MYALGVLRRSGRGIVKRVHDVLAGDVVVSDLHYNCHIGCGRVVIGVVYSRAVYKVGIFKAELLCSVVHKLHKAFFRACNEVFKSYYRVCAAGEDSSVEQILCDYLLARLEASHRSLFLDELGEIGILERVCIVIRPQVLSSNEYSHYLCERGRVNALVDVASRKYRIRIKVNEK